jgi:hypothetical protein
MIPSGRARNMATSLHSVAGTVSAHLSNARRRGRHSDNMPMLEADLSEYFGDLEQAQVAAKMLHTGVSELLDLARMELRDLNR